MTKHRITHRYGRIRSTRSAFTLVEILVALGVMMLLLVIILVPVNMGLDLFHIGKARSEVTQANQLVLNQLANELRQAVYVFPNENMPGITTKVPYTNNTTSPNFAPYYDSALTPSRVSNTARIDFLLPVSASNGSITTPLKPTTYLVTYYARRLFTDRDYDGFSNPILLWRAQYAYGSDNTAVANLGNTRYDDWSSTSTDWLKQTMGEPNLQIQGSNDTALISASHTQIVPSDMALVASRAGLPVPPVDSNGNSVIDESEIRSYQPDSSFVCDDTNGDGKIDRVSMSLLMAKYDSIGAESRNQQIRLTRTVELPNIK